VISAEDHGWQLRRRDAFARCILRNIGDRVELHIAMSHDVVMSQQCAGPEQASAIARAWRAALIERGWVETDSTVLVRPKRDRRAHPAAIASGSTPSATRDEG